jgi:O-antigen/teichoic acid export membrane protein
MSKLDVSTIKTRSLRGIFALIQQSFFIQLVGLGTFFVLAAYLKNEEIGLFGIANSIIGFMTYFSDIGLAGALIQKKEDLTRDDLATTFTIQQILAVIIVGIGFACTPLFQSLYHFNERGVYLLWALLISFLISSFKTIPALLLERKLEFVKVVTTQVLETLVYNILVIICVFKGMGALSFAIAALLRSVVGLIAIFWFSPWRIELGISKTAAKKLFRFGLPYQSISFLALLKDDLLFLFLGKVLALDAMGYIYVAKKFAELPLRTIMDNVLRVTFPTYSRLQHDKALLTKAIENTFFGISSLLFPLYSGLIAFIGPLFILVPKYHHWQPALVSIYLIALTSVAASFSTPLTNALSAIGKIRITLIFMVLWLVLSWMFVLIFVPMIGFNGFALSLLLMSLTTFLVIYVAKREIPFSVIRSIRVPFMAVVVQSALYYVLVNALPITWMNEIGVGLLGVLSYAGIVGSMERHRILFILNGIRGRA